MEKSIMGRPYKKCRNPPPYKSKVWPSFPVLTRISFKEFLFLAAALAILTADSLLRLFLWMIPFRQASPQSEEKFLIEGKSLEDYSSIPSHARELAKKHGLHFEEHIVESDGYVLGLHRVMKPVKIKTNKDSLEPNSKKLPVVLLGHGFLMSSDVWLCGPRKSALAPLLVDLGYDVWLLNTRGNKYSFKHRRIIPSEEQFWDFSLDEFARDLYDCVEYILSYTKNKDLFYTGFSQGTAQLFIALSTWPELNDKIRLACCLAPTAKPLDLSGSFVATLVKSAPSVLYLLFGRRAALTSVAYWNKVLSRKTWTRLLDFSMGFLFSWTLAEIREEDKAAYYSYLYSPSSVKTIVHWFQIIRSASFSLYDDAPGFRSPHSSTHVPVKYPLKSIKTPLALFYGGSDTLSDIKYLQEALPQIEYTLCIDSYEHLDCIWAGTIAERLYPSMFDLMNKFK